MTDVIIGPSTTKRADGGPGRATLAERLTRLYRTEIAIAAAIVAILVTVSFWSPYVLTWGNLANIAQASAPLILMSLGVFLVIATSGIDLSVGSTFSLTGMIGGLLLSSGLPWPVASLISLGVGIGVGAVCSDVNYLCDRWKSCFRDHQWPLDCYCQSRFLAVERR